VHGRKSSKYADNLYVRHLGNLIYLNNWPQQRLIAAVIKVSIKKRPYCCATRSQTCAMITDYLRWAFYRISIFAYSHRQSEYIYYYGLVRANRSRNGMGWKGDDGNAIIGTSKIVNWNVWSGWTASRCAPRHSPLNLYPFEHATFARTLNIKRRMRCFLFIICLSEVPFKKISSSAVF